MFIGYWERDYQHSEKTGMEGKGDGERKEGSKGETW